MMSTNSKIRKTVNADVILGVDRLLCGSVAFVPVAAVVNVTVSLLLYLYYTANIYCDFGFVCNRSWMRKSNAIGTARYDDSRDLPTHLIPTIISHHCLQ